MKSQFRYVFEQLRARAPKASRWFIRQQVKNYIAGKPVWLR